LGQDHVAQLLEPIQSVDVAPLSAPGTAWIGRYDLADETGCELVKRSPPPESLQLNSELRMMKKMMKIDQEGVRMMSTRRDDGCAIRLREPRMIPR